MKVLKEEVPRDRNWKQKKSDEKMVETKSRTVHTDRRLLYLGSCRFFFCLCVCVFVRFFLLARKFVSRCLGNEQRNRRGTRSHPHETATEQNETENERETRKKKTNVFSSRNSFVN